MVAKQIQRHNVSDDLYLYQQTNSRRWYARFKIDNQWIAKATGEGDLNKAIVKSIEMRAEYRFMVSNKIPVHTSKLAKRGLFVTLAKKVIKQMEEDLKSNIGKVIYKDYIGALNKYHIPFFDKTPIVDIDQQMLVRFDAWRIKELGRIPSKSTILTHNAVMNRVYEEAVLQKLLLVTHVPVLKNTGVTGVRRASFEKEEYKALLTAAKRWVKEGKKRSTRDIRQLLVYYIQVAVMTGLRPGKEIDRLTWNDVHTREIKDKKYTTLTVRKGKTTKYTGTREVVCKDEIVPLIAALRRWRKDYKQDDLIFVLPDGKVTKELARNFKLLLRNQKMEAGSRGVRSLYSLRHSYITWSLEDGTDIQVIATQCGTSTEMIERHYSHVVPAMFAEELSGRKPESDSLSNIDNFQSPINFEGTGTLAIRNGVVVVEKQYD